MYLYISVVIAGTPALDAPLVVVTSKLKKKITIIMPHRQCKTPRCTFYSFRWPLRTSRHHNNRTTSRQYTSFARNITNNLFFSLDKLCTRASTHGLFTPTSRRIPLLFHDTKVCVPNSSKRVAIRFGFASCTPPVCLAWVSTGVLVDSSARIWKK